MARVSERTGRCLCGAVGVRAETASPSVGACHCRMCRRWTGGPWMAVECGAVVHFEGEEHVASFASSAWAERGFCRQCGTHLYYRLKQDGRLFVPAGLFDQTDDLVFDHQIFVDEQPTYYRFANETRSLTGAQVLAQVASASE